MKNLVLFILSLLGFSAFSATLDLSTGTISNKDVSTNIQRNVTSFDNGSEIAENDKEVTFLSDDRVWTYLDVAHREDGDKARQSFVRLNGTKEINGRSYHKVYEHNTELVDYPLSDLDYMGDFDFENTEPVAYIRQEGQKYFMLLDSRMKDSGMYGSDFEESLIYDFGAQNGDEWALFAKTIEDSSLVSTQSEGFRNYNLGCFSEDSKIKISNWISVERFGNNWDLQQNNLYDAIPQLGVTSGQSLYNPGHPFEWTTASGGAFILLSVRDLSGNYIYVAPAESSGISSASEDVCKAEFNNGSFRIISEGDINMSVFNISGICLGTYSGSGMIEGEIPEIVSGVYMARIHTASGVRTEKFIVK